MLQTQTLSQSGSSRRACFKTFCAKCEADHILVAAMNVKNFSMTQFWRRAMQTNMDVVLALGFIALALICVAAEVLYFLPLPI
jgi:hypothetical protein